MTYLIRFVTHSCLVDDSWRIWYIFLHTSALFMTHDVFDTFFYTPLPCLWLMTYLILILAHSGLVYDSWHISYIFPTHTGLVYDSWRLWYTFPHTPALFMTHDVFDTFSNTLRHCLWVMTYLIHFHTHRWHCLWPMTYLLLFPAHSGLVYDS